MNPDALAALRHCYIVANLAVFAFLVVAEGGSDRRIAFPDRLAHIGRNLGLFVFVLLVADAVLLAWWLGVPSVLLVSEGLLTPLALPPLAQFAIGFVLLDLFDYGVHRLSHALRPLWFLHAVHHSDRHLDASTALRFHPLEVALQVAGMVALLGALGIPLWVAGARSILMNPLSMLQHANLVVPGWLERVARPVFVTPAMHRLHHADDRRLADSNYGVVLSVWDRLFGTCTTPAGDPPRFGVPPLDAERWQTVSGMLATPLLGPARGAL